MATFNSISFDSPYANALSDTGSLDIVVGLLREQKGDMLKMASYLGGLGLKPNLKDKIIETGLIRILVDVLQGRPLDPEVIQRAFFRSYALTLASFEFWLSLTG